MNFITCTQMFIEYKWLISGGQFFKLASQALMFRRKRWWATSLRLESAGFDEIVKGELSVAVPVRLLHDVIHVDLQLPHFALLQCRLQLFPRDEAIFVPVKLLEDVAHLSIPELIQVTI